MPAHPASRNTHLGKPVQLLVEGNDMKNFFEALLDYLERGSGVEVHSFGGGGDMADYLGAFVNVPGFDRIVRSIGIVRDAERNAEHTLQSVQTALEKANLPVPDRPGVRVDGNPAVSVLILPGDNRPGMLETLLCESIEQNEAEACIEAYFHCLDAVGIEVKRPDKARARVYITTKPDAHVSVGVAAKKKYWPFEHQAFTHVRHFLTQL